MARSVTVTGASVADRKELTEESERPLIARLFAALADSRSLRRAAPLHKVPYYTTLSGAVAAAQGIRAYRDGDLEVRTLQSYFSET